MSNREAAMMKIEQDKNKKNKSGNQRMTYMKQDNWRQEIISLNEGCKTFQPQSSLKSWPERIYNSHYGNGVPAMFTS